MFVVFECELRSLCEREEIACAGPMPYNMWWENRTYKSTVPQSLRSRRRTRQHATSHLRRKARANGDAAASVSRANVNKPLYWRHREQCGVRAHTENWTFWAVSSAVVPVFLLSKPIDGLICTRAGFSVGVNVCMCVCVYLGKEVWVAHDLMYTSSSKCKSDRRRKRLAGMCVSFWTFNVLRTAFFSHPWH